MRKCLIAFALTVAIAACSKVNQDNFLKIDDGMTEQEVHAILGKPTESNSVNLLGMSGTLSRWVAGDAVITVRFINGKVALKTFEKMPK